MAFAVYLSGHGEGFRMSDHAESGSCRAGLFSPLRVHGVVWAIVLLLVTVSGLLCAATGPVIEIDSIEELQRIGHDAAYPLDGNNVLTQDIDASATATWNDGAGFDPIGDDHNKFAGVFDGQGYGILSLIVYRPLESDIGLFSHISVNGEVHNLGLQGGRITGSGTVGALAGIIRVWRRYRRPRMVSARGWGEAGRYETEPDRRQCGALGLHTPRSHDFGAATYPRAGFKASILSRPMVNVEQSDSGPAVYADFRLRRCSKGANGPSSASFL